MKYDEMICFRCAVAVAVSCLEDERPRGDAATPHSVAKYIAHVLDIWTKMTPSNRVTAIPVMDANDAGYTPR